MKRKYVPVRMRTEVLERVKKEAIARGLSISETIGTLVEKSFESALDNRSEETGRGAGFDTETIKEIIEEAIKNLPSSMIRHQVEVALKNLPGLVPGIDPKVIRYQVETLARIDSILEEMTSARPGGEGKHQDWIQAANAKVKKIVQELRIEDESAPMETSSPKKTFPRIGEKQETEKSDLDFFRSLPQI